MKVLFLDENHELLEKGLEALGYVCDHDYESGVGQIIGKLKKYTGIIIRSRLKIDKSFLDAATQLKFIGRVGAGLENIDTDYATLKKIAIFNAPEGNRNAVAEHALGMLLALFNKLNWIDLEVRKGKWVREGNRGEELDGKTIGLIGYGNMGKAFAKKLSGFDVEVLCYDIQSNMGNEHAQQVEMNQIFEKADVLSLHIPLTEKTYQLVDLKFIQKFKKPIYIVNTARGKSLVIKDLVYALEIGKVKGACLDVLEYEKSNFEALFTPEMPKALQSILQSKNVLFSPHIAGWTHQSKRKLAQTIVDKVTREFHD